MALRLPSAEFQAKLAAALRREPFDVVQIEGIEMAPHWMHWRVSNTQYPIFVFDDHNAEYVLQQRAFETDVRQPARWVGALYSLIQWKKLCRYEAMVCRLADQVVAVSEADEAALQRLVPGLEVTVVPNGVDTEFYNDQFPMINDQSKSGHWDLDIGHCSLVFTGKMDFRPNVDAVLWFCQEVLPLVQRRMPDVRFYIVGQSPHRRVLRLANDPAVTITGYVDDVRPYIAGACVYVIPLRMGGGTRLKVLEAMAMGKPIVSTSLGCEGFEGLVPGRELSVADTPKEFARQVIELLGDAFRRENLGHAARRFVEEQYDWRLIVPKLEQLYEK
jgi:glycosyltransferase involved in cell wall biosynthesis